MPGALHTGYGWVQISMGQQLLELPLWLVVLLPLAKILATSLSMGSVLDSPHQYLRIAFSKVVPTCTGNPTHCDTASFAECDLTCTNCPRCFCATAYEPPPDQSVAAIAGREGRHPEAALYDLMLGTDGRELLLFLST